MRKLLTLLVLFVMVASATTADAASFGRSGGFGGSYRSSGGYSSFSRSSSFGSYSRPSVPVSNTYTRASGFSNPVSSVKAPTSYSSGSARVTGVSGGNTTVVHNYGGGGGGFFTGLLLGNMMGQPYGYGGYGGGYYGGGNVAGGGVDGSYPVDYYAMQHPYLSAVYTVASVLVFFCFWLFIIILAAKIILWLTRDDDPTWY